MTTSLSRNHRLAIALTALALAASCASNDPPERGGGPPGMREMRGPSFAEIQARPAAMLFVAMDSDADLLTSSNEAAAGIETEWARADADGDGQVSGFEMEAWSLAVLGSIDAAPVRIAFDVDLDGAVTPAEFQTRLGDEFHRMDRNKDGSLSRAEMLAEVRATARGGGDQRPFGDGEDRRRPPR